MNNPVYFRSDNSLKEHNTLIKRAGLETLPSILGTFPPSEMYIIVQASRDSSVGIANTLLAGRSGVLNPEMDGDLSFPQFVKYS